MLHYGPHEEIVAAVTRNGVGGIWAEICLFAIVWGIWLRCFWQRIKEFFKRKDKQ